MTLLRHVSVFLVTAFVVAVCALISGRASAQTIAAASDAAQSGATASPTEVRLVVTFLNVLPPMAAIKVAYDRGYFKDAGLKLTFASAIGGGDTLRPLTTGDADIAIGSPAASTLAVLKNPGLKIVAIWLPYNTIYWIGTKPLAQLNGAVVGGSVGGSTVNLLLSGLEEKLHVKFDVQKAGTGSEADNWDAVKAGHLQAAWAVEPFLTEKLRSDGAQIVIDPVKLIPDFPIDFVVVDDKFATSHAPAMKDFFRAIERIFSEFPDRSKQAALAKDLAGEMAFPEPVIQQFLSGASPEQLSKTYTLRMNANVFENISHLLQLAKMINAPVEWAKYVDQSYLPVGDRLSKLP